MFEKTKMFAASLNAGPNTGHPHELKGRHSEVKRADATFALTVDSAR